MEDEFGSLTSIDLMVEDITSDEANSLYNELLDVSNVEAVLFDNNESSYKNNNALYTIELKYLSDEQIDEAKINIQSVVKNKEYSIYSDTFEEPTEGIDKILLIACIVIVIVLLLTSKTYFEPVIAFIIFGISIILNMGSNFLFGEISYITKSIRIYYYSYNISRNIFTYI